MLSRVGKLARLRAERVQRSIKKSLNSLLECLTNVRFIGSIFQQVDFGGDAHDLKCRTSPALRRNMTDGFLDLRQSVPDRRVFRFAVLSRQVIILARERQHRTSDLHRIPAQRAIAQRFRALALSGRAVMSDLSPQGDAKRTLTGLGYRSCASSLVLYVSLNDFPETFGRAQA